jgi:hypothetical protein
MLNWGMMDQFFCFCFMRFDHNIQKIVTFQIKHGPTGTNWIIILEGSAYNQKKQMLDYM